MKLEITITLILVANAIASWVVGSSETWSLISWILLAAHIVSYIGAILFVMAIFGPAIAVLSSRAKKEDHRQAE